MLDKQIYGPIIIKSKSYANNKDRKVLNKAYLISREDAYICGVDWFNESFKQVAKRYRNQKIFLKWRVKDGNKIKENQFFAVAILRFIGGIPTQIQNLIPVLFDIKLKFYFFGTLIGVIIQAFIVCSLGSAIEKKIYESDNLPKILDLLQSKEIYLPIFAIIFLFGITFILRKYFFKR